MPKDWSAKISTVNFRCTKCRAAFEGEPDLIEDDAEQAHHPFRYFAHCPGCGAQHQPQASWERALLKAHQFSTGPKSEQGKAASGANLDGHPTPTEALRTRFNAMKHGAAARTATYFPAKPDGYAFCARCDVDRAWCAQQPACVKQTEIFMLHHAAFEQRNPRVLSAMRELNERIKRLEGGLTDLENEQALPENMPQIDPEDAADYLRGIVLDCNDPKKLREFVGTFVKAITVGESEVLVDYHPECLVQMNHRSVVHSARNWLLDLGSNQGPTD